MKVEKRIDLLHQLGDLLRQYFTLPMGSPANPFLQELRKTIERQQYQNGWFTPENVEEALKAITNWLEREKLEEWIRPYPLPKTGREVRSLGIVMAGNLPLVGFHDFLAGFLSGHKLLIRLSSKDPDLLPLLCRFLFEQEPKLKSQIQFTNRAFQETEAVIATGSSNTARYFEYACASRPHIIRKNRNSVALLDGSESGEELKALARDVFQYYGLGCRNVTKLYIPDEKILPSLLSSWQSQKKRNENPKYAGNYRYQKAIHRCLDEEVIDGGFFLLKENTALNSPVALVHYEKYQQHSFVEEQLNIAKDHIQCILGKGFLPFGSSQQPRLEEYADHLDSLEFLSAL